MKKMFTIQRHSYVFYFLLFVFFATQTHAQSGSNKCGFTAQIVSGSLINVCGSSPATLSSQPAVTGYTSQWQVQTTAGGPFSNISAATGAVYNTNVLGAYRVLITKNSCTDTSGISNIIHFDPQGGTITGGSTNKICQGENGGLLTGTQVPGADIGVIKYQWEKNENNAGWVALSGANDMNLFVGPIYYTSGFRRYSFDNCGNKAYSNIITLTATPDVIAGTISPATQTINAGSAAGVLNSVTAGSGGSGTLSYQWQSSLYERGPYTNIAGATSANYSPGVLNQTAYFKRVTIDAGCHSSNATSSVVVFVNGGILTPGYFTTNSSCFFTGKMPAVLETAMPPAGGVSPYMVEWQSSTDNVNFTSIPGANGPKYQSVVLTQSTYFRKKIIDAKGQVAYTTSEKISHIETPLTGGTIMATSPVACLGSSAAPIISKASPAGYGEKLSYQWQYKTTGGAWIDIPGQIREGYTPDAISEKTFFRRAAMDACGPNTRMVYSNEVEIDTRPALIAGAIKPTTQMIATGGTPIALNSSEDPSGGTGSYSITWESGALAVGPWTQVTAASAARYQPPSLTQTTYYRRVVKDNNCLATKYTYVVEVSVVKSSPLIGGMLAGSTCVFPGNRPAPISTSGAKMVSGGTQPYTFQWEQRAGNTGPFVIIPGATTEKFQPQIITETHQYRRRVMDAFGQFAYSDTLTIEYHTAPLNPGTIATTTPTALCMGTTPGIIVSTASLSGYGESAAYQWQMHTDGGAWIDIANAIRENYSPGLITEKTWFRRVGFDQCSGVKRTVYSNEVVFELVPKVPLNAGFINSCTILACPGTPPGAITSALDACGSGGVKYEWEINSGNGWMIVPGASAASFIPKAISIITKYRRKVTDACGNSGYSNEVVIYIYPPIEPGTIGTVTQTVCGGQKPIKIKLQNECHYTNGVVTYQWQSSTSENGPWTNISGATGVEYQPMSVGKTMYYRLKVMSTTCAAVVYTNIVSVIVNQGCQRIASEEITSEDKALQVFPNPLTGNSLTVKLKTDGPVSVVLQNAEGKTIPGKVTKAGGGLLKVNFSQQPSKGMYLITVYAGNDRYTEKIIVQ